MSTADRIPQLQAERDALVRQLLGRDSESSTTAAPPRPQPVTDADVQTALEAARRAKTERVRLLGRYNRVKDVAQGLIGMVAEQRACRVVDVMRDLGVDDDGED